MDENEIKEGLRGLTLKEPALGFDPDDVATRGARNQRTRRASLAVGAGTLAIAAVAAVVFSTSGGESLPVTPATSAIPTPSMSDSPHPRSSGAATPVDPAHDLTRQIARNKAHLMQVLPALKSDAREMEVTSAGQDYPTEPRSWDVTHVAVQFVDPVGPASINVVVRGKVSDGTFPGPDDCGGTCERRPQPDGSLVVLENNSSEGPKGKVPSERNATHFRTDGTRVWIMNDTLISGNMADRYGLPKSGIRKSYPLTDDQLIALVTDPGFNLK